MVGKWTERKAESEEECDKVDGEWTPPEKVENEEDCAKGKDDTAGFVQQDGEPTEKKVWENNANLKDSGYLDIYPCWGFKQQQFIAEKNENALLDDVIEQKHQGKPIKGLFGDDDPYRDFHPTEGIFSNFEFVNTGLGTCYLGGVEIVEFEHNEELCTCSLGHSSHNEDHFLGNQDIDDFFQPGTAAQQDCFKKWKAVSNKSTTNWPDESVTSDNMGNQSKTEFMWFVENNAVFRSHCTPWGACHKAGTKGDNEKGAEIKELHTEAGGAGNNIHTSKYGCEMACFRVETKSGDDGPVPVEPAKATGKAIVAYYTENIPKFGHIKGDPARSGDEPQLFEKRVEEGKVAFIESAHECVESGQDMGEGTDGSPRAPEIRQAFYIKGGGDKVTALMQGDKGGNISTTNAGMYSPLCEAISFRSANHDCCKVPAGETATAESGIVFSGGSCTDAVSQLDCKERYDEGWWTPASGGKLIDYHYCKVVPPKKNPKPGYIHVRQRVKGICVDANGRHVTGDKGEKIHNECECYQRGKNNKMKTKPDDAEKDMLVGIPYLPRTATIPIDLGHAGYNGGPKADHNARPTTEFLGYYYATVTELRYAAHSIESWQEYLRQIGSHLPCFMYGARGKAHETSKWKDYCATAHHITHKAGQSSHTIWVTNALAKAGHGQNPHPPTADIMHSIGDPNKDAAKSKIGHLCGSAEKNAQMTPHEVSLVEFGLAYNAVKEMATQFYGRKYLVPLPFNPPTTITCTNPKYADNSPEEGCEANGYDWGPHGLLSRWFNRFGVGTCVNKMNVIQKALDKITCEQGRNIWIEPIQESNKWEIASAGWPGGELVAFGNSPYDAGQNTGYPQNMNFWTDEGNLKSFAIFPEKEWKRLSGKSKVVDFSGFDAEQIHIDKHKAGPKEGWGNKVYVTTDVDPKTHWLPVRPQWEIQHEEQYYRFTAGDKGQANGWTQNVSEDNWPKPQKDWGPHYATIGPPLNVSSNEPGAEADNQHLIKKLDNRKVFIRNVGKCVTVADGKEAKPKTSAECEKLNPSGGKDPTHKWMPSNEEFVAYKPYALITLPAPARYPEIDIAILDDALGSIANEMCIPLTHGKKTNALLSAWVMGQNAQNIAAQTVVALLNMNKLATSQSPDMGDSEFVTASYAPWHAAVPQQSNNHKWGPWVHWSGFGKVELEVDEILHPATFNGEALMNDVATSKIKAAIADQDTSIETGSVTLAGFGKDIVGWCGNETGSAAIDAANRKECKDKKGIWHGTGPNYNSSTSGPGLGDRLIGNGPYITDINVGISPNGVNVTYNLSTQRKFGDLDTIRSDKIKKSQKEALNLRVKAEQEIQRTKRGIRSYTKPKND